MGAAAQAVLGRIGTCLDLELLDCLNGWSENRDVCPRIFGVDTIEGDRSVNLADSVGNDGNTGARNGETAATISESGPKSKLNAGNQHRQIAYVSAVKRQLYDAAVLDDLADSGILGL